MTLIPLVVAMLLTPAPAALQESRPAPSASYVQALHTADLFLAAWARRDADLGLTLMSRRLLRAGQADSTETTACLRQYLQGLSNPHHSSFEIGAGVSLGATGFAFPVVLFECYGDVSTVHRVEGTLEVQPERDAWRVDRVPRPECGE
jgi:hypothetical protein